MKWDQIRAAYPGQWLIIEAISAHSEGDRRILDAIAVVETHADPDAVYRRYRELHRQFPQRELYFVHTARTELDIRERLWLGLRTAQAAVLSRGLL